MNFDDFSMVSHMPCSVSLPFFCSLSMEEEEYPQHGSCLRKIRRKNRYGPESDNLVSKYWGTSLCSLISFTFQTRSHTQNDG